MKIFSSCPICKKGSVKKVVIAQGSHTGYSLACHKCHSEWIEEGNHYTLVRGDSHLVGHSFPKDAWPKIRKHAHNVQPKHLNTEIVGYVVVGLGVLTVLMTWGRVGYYIALVLAFGVLAWLFPQILSRINEE